MPTDRELMQQALDALDAYSWEQVQAATAALRARLAQPEPHLERLCRIMGTFDMATGHADTMDSALDSLESEIREMRNFYRARLAQPEPEPVAWRKQGNGEYVYADDLHDFPTCEDYGWEPLYAAPPQRKEEPKPYDKSELNAFVQDLYDEKMREGKHGHYETMFHVIHQVIKRVNANTQPFAWVHWITTEGERFPQLTLVPRTDNDVPLYTAPPQRETVWCDCGDGIVPNDGAKCGTCVSMDKQREWVGLTDQEVDDLWDCIIEDRPQALHFAFAIEAKLKEKNNG